MRGGGVLVFVPDSCQAWRRQDLEENEVEAVWIELHLEGETMLLCNVYRPPNSTSSSVERIGSMIEQAAN